jgi:hypothetical protein
MGTLHIGEEVSLFGLPTSEFNGKCGWIVSDMQNKAYDVWFGEARCKPIAVLSEYLTPTQRMGFHPELLNIKFWLRTGAKPAMTAKEIKQAFADNFERPLQALLTRLTAPANFQKKALQMPALVKNGIYALLEDFMKWKMTIQSDFFHSVCKDNTRKKGTGIALVKFLTSLRAFRKAIAGAVVSPYMMADDWGLAAPTSIDPDPGLVALQNAVSQGNSRCVIVLSCGLEAPEIGDIFENTKCVDFDAPRVSWVDRELLRLENRFAQDPSRAAALHEMEETCIQLAQESETCAICPLQGPGWGLKRCSACSVTAYCGKAHQRENWHAHREYCQGLKAKRLRTILLRKIVRAANAFSHSPLAPSPAQSYT